jgi:hypothetical protein
MPSTMAAVVVSLQVFKAIYFSEHSPFPRTVAPIANPMLLASLDIHDELSTVH